MCAAQYKYLVDGQWLTSPIEPTGADDSVRGCVLLTCVALIMTRLYCVWLLMRGINVPIAQGHVNNQRHVVNSVQFAWKQEWGGSEVFVIGDFTAWGELLPMEYDAEQQQYILAASLPVRVALPLQLPLATTALPTNPHSLARTATSFWWMVSGRCPQTRQWLQTMMGTCATRCGFAVDVRRCIATPVL